MSFYKVFTNDAILLCVKLSSQALQVYPCICLTFFLKTVYFFSILL